MSLPVTVCPWPVSCRLTNSRPKKLSEGPANVNGMILIGTKMYKCVCVTDNMKLIRVFAKP